MEIKHEKLKAWIKDMAAMCNPDAIVWIDGSEGQKSQLQRQAIKTGEMLELNQEKLPGCIYHRTALNDVARTEHLTYICTPEKKGGGPYK